MSTEAILAFIQKYSFILLPIIAGMFISFASEFLNKFTPKWLSNHLFLFLLSVGGTSITLWAFPYLPSVSTGFTVFMFCLTLFFSYLFYAMWGKKLVGKLIDKLGGEAEKVIDKVGNDQN